MGSGSGHFEVKMTPESSPMLRVEALADVLLPLLLEFDVMMDVWSGINLRLLLRLLRYREHVWQHYQREQAASWALEGSLDQLIGDHCDGGWPLEGPRAANDNISERRPVTAASPPGSF
jgi:hypothetical protein